MEPNLESAAPFILIGTYVVNQGLSLAADYFFWNRWSEATVAGEIGYDDPNFTRFVSMDLGYYYSTFGYIKLAAALALSAGGMIAKVSGDENTASTCGYLAFAELAGSFTDLAMGINGNKPATYWFFAPLLFPIRRMLARKRANEEMLTTIAEHPSTDNHDGQFSGNINLSQSYSRYILRIDSPYPLDIFTLFATLNTN